MVGACAEYSESGLVRYVDEEATGGVNSWFGGAYSLFGECQGCADRAEFVGYVKTAIDEATTMFKPRRVLLMHAIREDDKSALSGIIDEIEEYAASKSVLINYVRVNEL